MKDLSGVFSEAERRTTGSISVSALRDLVGSREGRAPSDVPVRSRELRELFETGGRASDSPAEGPSPAEATLDRAGTVSGTARLVDFVGAAEIAASIPPASGGREWMSPDQVIAGTRPLLDARQRGRVGNWLSGGVAVLAAVALVAVVGFAVVQRATSNPALEAMVSLREREAELDNDLQTLRTAMRFYDSAVAEAAELSELSGRIFTSLDGQVDAAPLQAAEAQRARLDSAVAAPLTVTIPAYERPEINEASLASVGKGLDAVRKVRDGIPTLLAEVRQARSSMAGVLGDFRSSLHDVGLNIESAAAADIARNSAADDGFRTAVQDAVDRLRQAQSSGSDGLAEMSTYSAALTGLRAENARVLNEIGNQTPPSGGTRSTGSSRGGQTTSPPANSSTGGNVGGQGGGGAAPDPGSSSGGSAPEPSPSESSTTPSVSPTPPPVAGLPTPVPTG